MVKFVSYTGKVLPDDLTAKLREPIERETQLLTKEICKTMFENQRLAKQLDRPSCKEFGPLIVSIDAHGNNLFEQNKIKFNEKKDAALAEILPQVGFIK
ncbi:fumarate hydratase [Campylobacter concisus]|uniref:fumarate hydratase n=1 Tax=Campylobacter concisus TaxID=199 RepID=UPI00214D23F1|nr:fumarate hydratase [Campylobacter concisus]